MNARAALDSLFESDFDDVPPPWAQGAYDAPDTLKLRGEYWIHPDGGLEFADGDVGDYNHEGLVCRHVLGTLASDFNLHDSEHIEYDEVEEAAQEEGQTMEEVAQSNFPKIPVAEVINAAQGHGDLRVFAMKYFNWKWMRGNDVTSWALAPGDLPAIGRGVSNALEQEGSDDYDAFAAFEVTVRDSKGRSFEASVESLEAGTLGQRNAQTWDNPEASTQQLRKADQQGTPSFYKGHLGDSQRS